MYLKNGVLTYTEWYYDKNGTLVIQMDAECDDQKVS